MQDSHHLLENALGALLIWAAAPALLTAQERPPLLWAEMRQRAEVRGTRILLGDLADVGGTDEQAAARAREFYLTDPPTPGQVLMLRPESIRRLLKRNGSVGEGIVLRGAPETLVTVKRIRLSGQDLQALVLAHLRRHLGVDAAFTRITRIWKPASLTAPAGRYLTRFEVTRMGEDLEGSGIIRLRVRPVVDGVPQGGTPVEVSLRRKTTVFVATRDLTSRHSVDLSSVRLERREIPGSARAYIRDMAELSALLPKARIRAGETLRKVDFKRRPVLMRNQRVRVLYRRGGLTIGSEGISLRQGAVGERILVRVGRRKRSIYAIVKDSKTVVAGPGAGKAIKP